MLILLKGPVTLSRLSMASWWTYRVPGITSALPTELAMMSTHNAHLAEEYQPEEQQL